MVFLALNMFWSEIMLATSTVLVDHFGVTNVGVYDMCL